MEQLQSSPPWRNKINGSSVMPRSDYNDVFGPFSIRIDDYSEIFDATALASIPVLDLSKVEQGFETVRDSDGVDYLDVFGNRGGGGFANSYEEMFAEPKISVGSSSEGRNRWDVLSERKGKEASEHPLKVYTANNEPNLEMKQYSSFLRQSDDINSKKFSMPYHRMSQETTDNDSKNKAFKNGTVNNMDTNGNSPDGGQKNQEHNFVVNPPESNCASLLDVPGDEKPNSQSHSSHSASSGYMLLHDVAYLKVSEISLQTKPFKGPPPSRPPPTLSIKPEHLKTMSGDPRVDVEEGSSLKSKVNNQLHSSNEAAKTQSIEESIKGISFSHDAEMDPSSAAAVSIAAVKEAIEQAQVRLTSAKKLMDRKRAKSDWKVGLPKAMSNEEDGTADVVTLKNCSTGIVANNLLTTNGECEGEEIRTRVRINLNHEERKMQLSSYRKDQQLVSKDNAFKSSVKREEIRNTSSKIDKKDEQQVRKENASKSSELTCKIVDIAGEWKIDEEYYELLRNDRFFNTVKGIYIQGDEEKPKTAICSFENKENYCNNSEQAVEVEHQQKSMEVSVCTEKLAKDNNLKVPSINGVVEDNMNLADAVMDEFLHKDYASELEEDYGSPLSDENQKQSETHEDKNNGNNANKLDFVVVCSLYEEKINEVGSNIFFESWLANGNCEEKELQAAEKKLSVGHEKFEVNESNKEVKVQNETLFQDMFKKEIKESDELLTFNTADQKEVDDEIKLSNYENETRSMTDQDSCSAYRFEIEKGDNTAEKDESDEFQTNEEAQILVENHLEQEAIQDENRLENGLEMPEAPGKIKDAELEKILNFTEGTYSKDCNEKESREVRTSLQKDGELVRPLMNQDVKKSEFLASAEEVCGNRVSENIAELPVLVETQISSNSADEDCQLGEIEESDTGNVFLSGKEGSLLATAPDATEDFHDEKAGNYKHSRYTEAEGNKSKMNVDRERNGGLETYLEQKDLKREKEREMIAAQRANYEARQQELAEARVRTERIAVERATAEARKRALEEARQKAEKAAEVEKASREARLRAERAAVERVTEEARKRAIEKALAEKTAVDTRERTAQVGTSKKDRLRNDNRTEHFKATRTQEHSEAKYKPTLAKDQRNAQSQTAASSANDHLYSESHSNVGGAESKLSKARQEKQQQTAERAAKALTERNMRDILTQREQAERDRLAESLDGDLRRWSSGKDGNLLALLSTLQYILGPDSGWQPIPLKDIMNASAAKKAYRKATLCVHPDKLQQRGASIQQKYICEKVFDLLQEAWNKFNSEER